MPPSPGSYRILPTTPSFLGIPSPARVFVSGTQAQNAVSRSAQRSRRRDTTIRTVAFSPVSIPPPFSLPSHEMKHRRLHVEKIFTKSRNSIQKTIRFYSSLFSCHPPYSYRSHPFLPPPLHHQCPSGPRWRSSRLSFTVIPFPRSYRRNRAPRRRKSE